MQKEILINEHGPKAIGPYSPSVKVDKLIFISGQLPIDPKTGAIVQGEIEIQTRRSLDNLIDTLTPYGLSAQDVVKVTIFLDDMENFSKVNEVYGKYFTREFPSRSCVQVARLPKNAKIEIEAIAYK
jgi:2-iminobutanoate/2-iminopropanoate deaminase